MHTPHLKNCPNAEHPVVATCAECGQEIELGTDHYKDVNQNDFCSTECALAFYMVHNVTDRDFDNRP